jgi:hypothetical protein
VPEPLACRLDAFEATGRKRHALLVRELAGAAIGIDEQPDGFTVRFPARPYLFLRIAEWMELERACCPSFDIRIDFETGAREFRVTLTGPEGAKEVLRAELPGLAAASPAR